MPWPSGMQFAEQVPASSAGRLRVKAVSLDEIAMMLDGMSVCGYYPVDELGVASLKAFCVRFQSPSLTTSFPALPRAVPAQSGSATRHEETRHVFPRDWTLHGHELAV